MSESQRARARLMSYQPPSSQYAVKLLDELLGAVRREVGGETAEKVRGQARRRCRNDTDGDGNCAACARNPEAPCRMTTREKILGYVEDNRDNVSDLLDAYAHELAEQQRDMLRKGFRMPGFATVLTEQGQHEPLGTTHVIDHIDPEITAVRPARVALAELMDPEVSS